MKGKLLSSVSGLAIFVAVFSLTFPIGDCQTGTNVSYIISSDTTWTQANSPYNFVGNVLVNQGTTLTIGAGSTVNLNNYYLRINGTVIIQPGATINLGLIGDGIDVYGTLSSQGTSENPIHINGAAQGHIFFAAYSSITFFPSSTGWNKQTDSGSLIKNTILNQTGLEMQSPIKVSDSTFLSGGLVAESASPIIVNNNIAGGLSVIQNPNTPGTIYNQGNGSFVIQPEISNNTITGSLYFQAGGGIVSDNTISVGESNPNSGYMGALSINDAYGSPISCLIKRNLINNSPIGISIYIQYPNNNKATIEDNTVTNNTVGLQLGSQNVPTIINNNIYGNSYNAKLSGVTSRISLPNNWWGTTDIQTINQTIYDFKNDFTLGIIDFLPILEAKNSQAAPSTVYPTNTPSPPTSSQPTIFQTPSPSPSLETPSTTPSTATPSATVPTELLTILLAIMAIIVVVVGVVAFNLGKRAGLKRNL